MHELFADWHREVSVDPTKIALGARWEALGSLAAHMTGRSALDSVRLAFEQSGSDEWLRSFRMAFKQKDETFGMRGNEREVAMLAGALCVHLVGSTGHLATTVANACGSAQFWGWKSLIPELPIVSANYSRSVPATPNQDLAIPEPALWTTKRKGAIEALDPNNSGYPGLAATIEVLSGLASSTDEAVKKSTAYATGRFSAQQQRLDHLNEMVEILWWLLSGESSSRSRPWHAFDSQAQVAIVAGWELGALTGDPALPAPANRLIRQILSFCGGREDPVTIAEAVAGLEPPSALTPLLGSAGNLAPIYERVTSQGAIGPAMEFRPLDLGTQAYRETLLGRALQGANNP